MANATPVFAEVILTSQRPLGSGSSKVVAWEGRVSLFENGAIRGEGLCREFSPGNAGRTLSAAEMPKGSAAAESGEKVILGVSGAGNDLTTLLLKSGEDFTVLKNARKLPGTALGNGKDITGKWLRGTEGNAGLFPKSIADKLRGKTFNNFDEFRQQFWKAVADDPSLANQFTLDNFYRMKAGAAPRVEFSQQLGGQQSYILHHKTPINQGGAIYDMDNLYIVTPKYHKEILDPAYDYGYGY